MAKARVRNLYWDYFEKEYELKYGLPYQRQKHDAVQLARLLLHSGVLSQKMTLEVWQRGVTNYLNSELGMHTLADIATRFVPFWRGPLDRFGKPKQSRANGNGQARPWLNEFLLKCYEVGKQDNGKLDALEALMEMASYLTPAEALKRLEAIEKGV